MKTKSEPVKQNHPKQDKITLHLGPLGGLVFAVFLIAICIFWFGAIAFVLLGVAVAAVCLWAWEAFDDMFLSPGRQRRARERMKKINAEREAKRILAKDT